MSVVCGCFLFFSGESSLKMRPDKITAGLK